VEYCNDQRTIYTGIISLDAEENIIFGKKLENR